MSTPDIDGVHGTICTEDQYQNSTLPFYHVRDIWSDHRVDCEHPLNLSQRLTSQIDATCS